MFTLYVSDCWSKLFEMEPGVLYFICYKSIKALVESGKIDLL
ncbi:putative DNA replication complex GINS protein SLD5 [Lupinus albus]|uniref:Putative DNA replication complex GINS protein SLD5 n=1 Tax=Lupinus albus TaxID=3870 RepID=A0A6A4NQF3_LUPAL|nr:putative DNA replication complex GINS protein SLD5 [Lupinus albus]